MNQKIDERKDLTIASILKELEAEFKEENYKVIEEALTTASKNLFLMDKLFSLEKGDNVLKTRKFIDMYIDYIFTYIVEAKKDAEVRRRISLCILAYFFFCKNKKQEIL